MKDDDTSDDDYMRSLRAYEAERPVTFREHLAAANARVAELEHVNDVLVAGLETAGARVAELESQLKAANIDADQNGIMAEKANARADAAVRDLIERTRMCESALATEREETARLKAELGDTIHEREMRIGKLTRGRDALETRLAAATKLLIEWQSNDPDGGHMRRDAFLAAQPAPAKEP